MRTSGRQARGRDIQAQGGAFEGLENVHVERHRVVDDLVEKRLPQIDFALPQRRLVVLALVPPKCAPVGDGRRNELLSVLVFVDQPDMGVKQPLLSSACSTRLSPARYRRSGNLSHTLI